MAEMEDLKRGSLHGHVLPFNLAIVYIGLGDRERALGYLERAYASDSQWMSWLKNDRIFDPLRSEPRFVALMRKLSIIEPGLVSISKAFFPDGTPSRNSKWRVLDENACII